jgi:transposase
MRRLSHKEKVAFKRGHWLLLVVAEIPEILQKERLSTLVRWNAPIVRAYYLKEAFQMFWDYRQPKRTGEPLQKWMHSAMRSRLEPFKQFVRMLRAHLDEILAWTENRVSKGAVEGMNNKIKSISHRSFGFRTAENFIAAIYHCCSLPATRRPLITLLGQEQVFVRPRVPTTCYYSAYGAPRIAGRTRF